MQELFSNIFGDKSWYQSLTAWGLVIWFGVDAALGQVTNAGLLPETLATSVTTWTTALGQLLTVLGVRKAATSSNTG